MLKLNTQSGNIREGDIEPGDFNPQIAIFLRF